jgi:glycosyltransferase involved in cell wall biosynthesis
MKKILFIHHCSGLGGAPLSLLYLIEKLDRTIYTPEVLFIGGEGAAVDLYRQRGITTHVRSDISFYPHAENSRLSINSLYPWRIITWGLKILPSAGRIKAFIQEHDYNIVHINTSVQIPSGLGAKWANIPIVWHIREPLYKGHYGVRLWFCQECIDKSANAIIAISKYDASKLKQSSKVHVVYNFVDFKQFDRSLTGKSFRESCGISSDKLLIGMLGGFIDSKGADVFVQAAAIVHKKRPDILFLIAGTSSKSESPVAWKRSIRRILEKLLCIRNMGRRVMGFIQDFKLEECIRLVGMRSDIPDMLAALEILVWPASVSHFARPIIEAGAMARPVIASDFPSSRELVIHNETGLLVHPSDPESLARAILYLIEHRDQAKNMGEAGYQLALERYDAHKNARQIFQIYAEVLSGASESA